jgi:hypothetical protein
MLIADDRDPMPLVICAASDRQQARLDEWQQTHQEQHDSQS